MTYLRIGIDTSPDGIEPITELLTALGADDYTVEDESEFLTFLEGNKKYWDYVDTDLLDSMKDVSRVTVYVQNDADSRVFLSVLPDELAEIRVRRCDVDFGTFNISVEEVDDAGWDSAWKQFYKPFKVGEKLFIVPHWESTENSEGRIMFLSDPGPAFGNGTHETTRLCLEAIEKYIRGGELLYDFGCGSGILSVCAVLLGASCAVGVDVDELAVSVSRKCAAINGISDKCEFIHADLTTENPFESAGSIDVADMVCANIVADAIISLSDMAFSILKSGGIFVASGIIDARGPETLQKIRSSGFIINEVAEDNGWIACISHKPCLEQP